MANPAGQGQRQALHAAHAEEDAAGRHADVDRPLNGDGDAPREWDFEVVEPAWPWAAESFRRRLIFFVRRITTKIY